MNSSDTVLFDVELDSGSTSSPTGSPTTANLRVETPASTRSITARVNGSRISEVLIGLDRQLVLVIDRAHPRLADLHAPPAERHRPTLMTVPLGDSISVPLALRANDLL